MHDARGTVKNTQDAWFFLNKKKMWAKQEQLVIHLFSLLANVFLDSLSTEVEPKKSRAEVAFFSLGLTGMKQE